MKKFKQHISIIILALVLFASQLVSGTAVSVDAASPEEPKSLVLYQNLPEVEPEINNNEVELQVLRVYEDGHYEKITEELEWKSTNKNVATVNQKGTATFTEKPGRTFIEVTDGTYSDRIALDFKPDKPKAAKGKSNFIPAIVKSQGEKYELIDTAIEMMTTKEKIGQMLMPDFRNWEGENVTEMLPEIENLVKEYHLGGVILFRENVVTTEQTAKLVSDYQAASDKYGMLLTIDQEGGIVTRLQSGTDMPGNMALGATRSTETAFNVGQAIGEELSALGINMNLAPVMDVNNNPDNPVIGVRSFGSSPDLVADLGIAYTKGLQTTGVAATAKHFPGHGDTAVDSHLGLPEVPHDKERLKEVELYPFQQAMETGLDAIMTAHVTFPKIDDTKVISQKDGTEIALPATLSKKVLTDLMREEMGYEGVIITDALNMKAIADHFGPVDAAIRAVKAGTDIVLMPVGLEEVAEGLLAAVESGEINEAAVEESVKRILTLKAKRGIFKESTPQPLDEKISKAKEIVGSEEHKQVEKDAAEQSITLVKNEAALPFAIDNNQKLVVIGSTYIDRLFESIQAYHGNTEMIRASGPLTDSQLETLADADSVVVGTYTYNVAGRSPDSSQMRLVNQLITHLEAPVIGIGIRNPYDLMAYPEIDAYLAQYGFNPSSFTATAATLFGENIPTGKLPIAIPGEGSQELYEFGHGLSY
ncbi:glycoside hydrolase family 3 N-terminal domain-containing protein [Sediminibacillus albus]|uniref:beta-N-acetylhexosaminidase n=1 Tax=Sediminibacillus albus TaxID=407036 RepID=A0A1G8YFE5_9BACI|nr:glycoside hydrolase family 3 N-terminal domain-containing protein [Sediminibacillus albus]SDK01558.1 beta-N-acetylhexosaminidase [Sediminibacillus albus]